MSRPKRKVRTQSIGTCATKYEQRPVTPCTIDTRNDSSHSHLQAVTPGAEAGQVRRAPKEPRGPATQLRASHSFVVRPCEVAQRHVPA